MGTLCKQVVDGFMRDGGHGMKEVTLKCTDILEWLETDDPSDDHVGQQLNCLRLEVNETHAGARGCRASDLGTLL